LRQKANPRRFTLSHKLEVVVILILWMQSGINFFRKILVHIIEPVRKPQFAFIGILYNALKSVSEEAFDAGRQDCGSYEVASKKKRSS